MEFYWIVLAVVFTTFSVIVLSTRYAVELKHLYDEDYKPSFHVNEGEVLVCGFLLGSLGLLISYLSFKEIRNEDSLNGRRFLWLSLAFFVLHALLIFLLSYYGLIVYTGF